PDAVLEKVAQTLSHATVNGVDEQVFERVKKAAYGHILKRFNFFESICYSAADGYFNGYDEFERASVIADVTPQQINEYIAQGFNSDNLAISVISPVG
ncbi:MAG: hypothetical protein IJ072_06230, partial [Oscillospiraceae bacterium]|nr:hypothetical protein [Oscillospiraceae bacterium]